MRRRNKLGILAILVAAATVPAALALSRSPAARPGQPAAPAGQIVPAAERHTDPNGQSGSVPHLVATPSPPSPPTGPGSHASQPTGTPPGITADAQDQEGPADQRDQDEREGENNTDDRPGDPGDPPGADHRCPPDCRSGEVG